MAIGSIYDFVSCIRSNRRIHFSGIDEYSVLKVSRLSVLLHSLPSPFPPLFSGLTADLAEYPFRFIHVRRLFYVTDYPSVKFPHPIKFDRH